MDELARLALTFVACTAAVILIPILATAMFIIGFDGDDY